MNNKLRPMLNEVVTRLSAIPSGIQLDCLSKAKKAAIGVQKEKQG